MDESAKELTSSSLIFRSFSYSFFYLIANFKSPTTVIELSANSVISSNFYLSPSFSFLSKTFSVVNSSISSLIYSSSSLTAEYSASVYLYSTDSCSVEVLEDIIYNKILFFINKF